MTFKEWLSLKTENDTQIDQPTELAPNVPAANAARQLGVDLTQFMQALKKVLNAPATPNTMLSRDDVNRVAAFLNIPGHYDGPKHLVKKWMG